MAKCFHCQTDLPDGARFCPGCGRDATPPAPAAPPPVYPPFEGPPPIDQRAFDSLPPLKRPGPNVGLIVVLTIAGLVGLASLGALINPAQREPGPQPNPTVTIPIAPPKPTPSASPTMDEDHRTGMHCLMTWDGSNREFAAAIKDKLRDPNSFEHDTTKIGPIDKKGRHLITMKFRSKNGFGGMNVGVAVGFVRNSDCTVIEASLIE